MITVDLVECEECGETFGIEDSKCMNELFEEFQGFDQVWWCRHCAEAFEDNERDKHLKYGDG